jgi:hypothetical protein
MTQLAGSAIRRYETREGWAAAAEAELARLHEGPAIEASAARLATYAFRCVECGHVAFSGAAGGCLEPCPCEEGNVERSYPDGPFGRRPDRRITALFAGHVRDMGLASELEGT